MFYSKKYNFLFCHISRTGGTSLCSVLRKTAPDLRMIGSQHASLLEARAALPEAFESTFKFAFVRNPWERLVSWYSLLEKGKSLHSEVVSEKRHYDEKEKFELFVQEMVTAQHGGIAWSQWSQLSDHLGNSLVNEICRFENYQKDSKRILRKLGSKDYYLPYYNQASSRHYCHYYSDLALKLAEELFLDDIYQFGYKF